MESQYEIMLPPTDGISSVNFAPTCNKLAVSSWDKTVRIYDADNNSTTCQYFHEGPVLDVAFLTDEKSCVSAGLDRKVKFFEVESFTDRVIGEHEKAARCVRYSKQEDVVISGGWDKKVKVWDVKKENPLVVTVEVPERVYAMSVIDHRVIVGTAGRHVYIYDLRDMSEPEQKRQSSLKYQTRCIECAPDSSGYALGSIEGRVAIEYFDPSPEIQAKKFAFKCHRQKINGVDTVYPVNCIAYHPIHGTFATGGCDKKVSVWDGNNRKKLSEFEYPTSISSLSFNKDGSLLAVASSYTYEEGEKEHPNDSIFIRPITNKDVQPRM